MERIRVIFRYQESRRALWSLDGVDYPFAIGLAYGILFAVDQLQPDTYEMVLYDYMVGNTLILPRLEQIEHDFIMVSGPYPVTQINNVVPAITTYYEYKFALVSRYPDEVYLVLGNEQFLQGLFTGLTATNTPYETVLLYRPWYREVQYDITGLGLPTLE